MTKISNVCVYCGASSAAAEIYQKSAHDIGAFLARDGYALVYGGGHVGLMGIAADAALAGGGKVIGIIPEFLQAREKEHTGLTEMHLVSSMHERKMMMAERADAFVILPGGFGTLDEFFEILTWRQLLLHKKPVIVVNINEYWTPLLALLDKIVEEKFARPEDRDHIGVARSVEEVLSLLAAARAEPLRPAQKEKM